MSNENETAASASYEPDDLVDIGNDMIMLVRGVVTDQRRLTVCDPRGEHNDGRDFDITFDDVVDHWEHRRPNRYEHARSEGWRFEWQPETQFIEASHEHSGRVLLVEVQRVPLSILCWQSLGRDIVAMLRGERV